MIKDDPIFLQYFSFLSLFSSLFSFLFSLLSCLLSLLSSLVSSLFSSLFSSLSSSQNVNYVSFFCEEMFVVITFIVFNFSNVILVPTVSILSIDATTSCLGNKWNQTET
eukprot:Lithocolla_globosa_v1_NODE_9_length_11346_cov_34.130712.p8 type:complete len:109 gc:universal NODE_9_length_11346_cov_34.130712:9085-9411(+)